MRVDPGATSATVLRVHYEFSRAALASPRRPSCHWRHGQTPSISTSSAELRRIRITTMMPRTATLSMVGDKRAEPAYNHDPRADRLNDLDDFRDDMLVAHGRLRTRAIQLDRARGLSRSQPVSARRG
jgi:hypothetical protein